MRRRRFLVGLAGAALASCTVRADAPAPSGSGSPLIATPARNIWPQRYRQAPALVRDAYVFAIAHREVLTYVPCFCGCGTLGHRDNYDCFVKAVPEPGSYVLDEHGFACGTCVSVALETKAMLAAGSSVKAIRRTIDERWAGIGTPTPTKRPD